MEPQVKSTLPFDGAKLALLSGGHVLSLLRDSRPDIPYPGLWDLPGGGREGAETEEQCALRETCEETGLVLDPAWIHWKRLYPGPEGAPRWFLVAELPVSALASQSAPGPGGLRLGDEGQALRWFPVTTFLKMDGAIVHLQDRLRDYLADRARRESNAHM